MMENATEVGKEILHLIQILPAVLGPAEAADFLLFDFELVIVSDLFTHSYGLLGINHDLLLLIDGYHFGVAIGLEKK